MCQVFIDCAKLWLEEKRQLVEYNKCPPIIEMDEECLEKKLKLIELIKGWPDERVAKHTNWPLSLFTDLSSFVCSLSWSAYIILIDNYDKPFLAVNRADWSKKERMSGRCMLDVLYTVMFKVSKML